MACLRNIAFAALFLFAAPSAFAQLGLDLNASQQCYMTREPIFLKISFRNDSGQALVFGDSEKLQGKLFLEMSDTVMSNSVIAPKKVITGEFPLYGCVIRPGELKELVLRFDEVMKIAKPGFYRIHAYVTHPLLKDAYQSNTVRIELNNGVTVRRFAVGVPKYLDNNQTQIATRTYTLRTLVDGTAKYYYVVLEDSEKVYQVVRIGSDMGIQMPRCETDMLSKLHVMVHISAKVVKHYIINIDGQIESCEYLKNGSTIPRLVRDSDGRVFTAGGEKAEENVDYVVKKSPLRARGE